MWGLGFKRMRHDGFGEKRWRKEVKRERGNACEYC